MARPPLSSVQRRSEGGWGVGGAQDDRSPRPRIVRTTAVRAVLLLTISMPVKDRRPWWHT